MTDESVPFRRLKHPVRLVSVPLCPLDKTDEERWGFGYDTRIKRPLVVGERVITMGLMGELRVGTVAKVDGDHATIDGDADIWIFTRIDADGWGTYGLAEKSMADIDGNFIQHEAN